MKLLFRLWMAALVLCLVSIPVGFVSADAMRYGLSLYFAGALVFVFSAGITIIVRVWRL